MKWEKILSLFLTLTLLSLNSNVAAQTEVSMQEQTLVMVDAREDYHGVNTYKTDTGGKQLGHMPEIYNPQGQGHGWFTEVEPPAGWVEMKDLMLMRKVFTRRQLEEIVKGDSISNDVSNMLGIIIPPEHRKPNDLIGLIMEIPPGKIMVNMGFNKALSEKEFLTGPIELMASLGQEAMNQGSRYLHPYSPGRKKILNESQESKGGGFGINGFPFASERFGIFGNFGKGNGSSNSRYDQFGIVQLEGVRIYDIEVMRQHWLNYKDKYCVDGEFYPPENRFDVYTEIPGMSFQKKIDAAVIEDWVIGSLFYYDCGVPEEFKTAGPEKNVTTTPETTPTETAPAPQPAKETVSVLPYTIKFIFGKAVLIPNQEAEVNNMVNYALGSWKYCYENGCQIIILGYCSVPGSKNLNWLLGSQRAMFMYEIMANALRHDGATEDQITKVLRPVSAGKFNPMENENQDNQAVRIALSKLIGEGGQK